MVESRDSGRVVYPFAEMTRLVSQTIRVTEIVGNGKSFSAAARQGVTERRDGNVSPGVVVVVVVPPLSETYRNAECPSHPDDFLIPGASAAYEHRTSIDLV